jgi:hypothetical protein
MIIELTEDNFTMYAIKHYDNPSCKGMDEFLNDLKRFKYIKRLLRKHNVGKELKERFYKLEEKFWPQVKTFLVFLNYMPLKVIVSPGIEILDKDISIDETILENLKRL